MPVHGNLLPMSDPNNCPNLPMSTSARFRRVLLPTALGMILVAMILWPVMWINPSYLIQGSSADHLYHFPTIEQFADELPSPHYDDYPAATAPGYHTLLAIPRSLGFGYTTIRMMGSLWTIAIMGALIGVCVRRFGYGALIVAMPVLITNYILFPGIWLLPDNAGWFGVVLITLLCLNDRVSNTRLVVMGACLLGLVWMRQVHIWAAAPIWLSAWIGSGAQVPAKPVEFFSSLGSRTNRGLIALICTLPAFGLLGWFVWMWGGLVPPTFQDEHAGINLATPGFVLLQISVLSVFFSPILLARLRGIWQGHRTVFLFVVGLGLLLGLGPVSSFSVDDGRYGGWWNLVRHTPEAMGRSPIFLIGSVAGSVCVMLWGSLCSRRDAWVLGSILAVFVCSQTINERSWQRYHEPMLIVLICIIFARSDIQTVRRRSVLVGSVALTALLAFVTATQLTEQVSRDSSDPRVDALRAKKASQNTIQNP